MRVRLWGVRGSIPTPGPETMEVGGNTPCVEVTAADGTELILDAGSGIRALGAVLLGRRRHLHILLTHLHLDHIQGLLFFAPLFDRQAEITVWAPPGQAPLRRRLARYLSNPLSPVEIRDLPARVAFEEVPHTAGASANSSSGRRWSHTADRPWATGSRPRAAASATSRTTSPDSARAFPRRRRAGSPALGSLTARPC